MNKQLFWAGIALQTVHLVAFMIFGLTLVSWNWKVILGIGYIIFNIVSLAMIFAGACMKEKKE